METKVEIKLTPKEMAGLIWAMYSDEQAEMFKHLHDIAEGEHNLMMQFLCTRDHCIERKDESLGAFQAMFSSAFTYAEL